MNILGKRVVLRAIEPIDLPMFLGWANDPDLQPMLAGWHFPISQRDQMQWYESLSCTSDHQRFSVTSERHGLIGSANLVSIDWKNRSAFHGLLLDLKFRGMGYGEDILMALMRYAFEELGLVRMDTEIIEYNEGSLSLHVKKCGWKLEGTKERALYRRGRHWSKFILGITDERYQHFVGETNYWGLEA
jgi:RimJ/RimL family protein N-acetyltransferase